MKLKKHNKYELEWIDIQHDDSWIDFEKVDDTPLVCNYMGYFVKETKECYVFASGYSADKQYYTIDLFPKGVVRKIKKI